jgi:hypothetical protein
MSRTRRGKVGPHFWTSVRLTRSEVKDPGPWKGGMCMMCHRAIVLPVSGTWPHRCSASSPLERAREQAQLRTCHPRTLHGSGPETDWCRSGLQTTACSPTLGWSIIAVKPIGRGGQQGGAAAGLLTKIHQNVCKNIILWGYVIISKIFGRPFCRNRFF